MRVVQQQTRKRGAGKVANDGNWRIAPVRSAFAWNREQPMHKTRTEIARGVDGVAGSSAER